MSKEENNKIYDLEERTTEFAKRIIKLCQVLTYNEINRQLVKQIIRSSGSIGANYREANDSMGKKDFLYRLKISRKEAKETKHWLSLISEANIDLIPRLGEIKKENSELIYIFSAIIRNYKEKSK